MGRVSFAIFPFKITLDIRALVENAQRVQLVCGSTKLI
jgi:hypothetical protein